MSWFSELSGKAENILNAIDKNTAKALNKQPRDYSNDSSLTLINNSSVLDVPISIFPHGLPSTSSDFSVLPVGDSNSSPDHWTEPDGTFQLKQGNNAEYLRNEMLQNEIHSLNNEISLLLNRVKLAEQKSADLLSQLAVVEERNLVLEERLSHSMHSTNDVSDDVKKGDMEEKNELQCAVENNDFDIHEHYNKLIQDLMHEKHLDNEMLRRKEDEIIMLKSRLSQKTYCFSADELQSRLRALTITLVEKQSALESIMVEKNTLQTKLNHLQKQYDEALGILHQSRINVNDTDDVKAQIPSYQFKSSISYYCMLASNLFPLRTRRRFISKDVSAPKIFLSFYIILLHIFVIISLHSYTPDNSK